jgi:hypothetical protein
MAAIEAVPYYSQHGEDRIICERVRLPEKGVFVDVGAGHPTEGSNTYHFEERGWTGLCIDADRRQVQELERSRRCVTVWKLISENPPGYGEYGEPGVLPINLAVEPSLTTVHHHLPDHDFVDIQYVPAAKLETVLLQHDIGHIDLLSIDVEGAEIEAWRSMDFNAHLPTVIVIEWNTQGRPSAEEAIRKEFRKLPYICFAKTPGNLLFAFEGALL